MSKENKKHNSVLFEKNIPHNLNLTQHTHQDDCLQKGP